MGNAAWLIEQATPRMFPACEKGIKVIRARRAFTLVELLVVIAIIGVLVALLLPAIQAAREAARRTQCKNNLKNVGLSVLNYESAHKEFPTGGASYGDRIECYAENGKAWVGKKQGMSWAYQILPYLEQGALHDIGDTDIVQSSHVPLYNCPSRRGPTLHDSFWGPSYLMDYAGAQPATLGASNSATQYVATRDYRELHTGGKLLLESQWTGIRLGPRTLECMTV